jgi:1,4-dihydroxy-2-naphthoyl-CoA hydrolase
MASSKQQATASAFVRAVGLAFDEVGPTRVTGTIKLGADHHQRGGIVHGGVYAAAIETAAGVGAGRAAREHGLVAVGVNNNTNFLRPVRTGRVSVLAEPIHQGRTQQLWEVRITDGDGRLVASGQVRLQNVAERS